MPSLLNTAKKYMKVEEKKVIGIVVQVTNKMAPDATIGDLWGEFFIGEIPLQIPNNINPNAALGLYYDYSDTSSPENYTYKYAACQEVSSLEDIPVGMVGLTIPKSEYQIFKIESKRPESTIQTWKQIYKESNNPNRSFTFDYEVYDFTTYNTENSTDVYVALK